MTTADSYIFGNSALHRRFCLITEILGKFVSNAPRTVSIEELTASTALPANELVKLCTDLWRSELVRPIPHRSGSWELSCEPSIVTLEDVYRCAIAERPHRTRPPKSGESAATAPGSLHHDVDLLIMQATMAINQSVFRHLRQFSLDRLKVATNSVFSGNTDSSYRHYANRKNTFSAF